MYAGFCPLYLITCSVRLETCILLVFRSPGVGCQFVMMTISTPDHTLLKSKWEQRDPLYDRTFSSKVQTGTENDSLRPNAALPYYKREKRPPLYYRTRSHTPNGSRDPLSTTERILPHSKREQKQSSPY
jgi:hypothetical protein